MENNTFLYSKRTQSCVQIRPINQKKHSYMKSQLQAKSPLIPHSPQQKLVSTF